MQDCRLFTFKSSSFSILVNMTVNSIFTFDDYKKYFNEWVHNQPKHGHGEYRRLSISLGVSTTLISQIFKGDKQISLEMANELCEYLELLVTQIWNNSEGLDADEPKLWLKERGFRSYP